MRFYLIVLFVALVTSSCALYSINSEDTTMDYFAPKASKEEVAYLENVGRPYQVIGQVTVNAERNQKMYRVIDKLKYEAAILGGDAITNITMNAGTGKWVQIKPKLFEKANVRSNFIADVIVFN